MRRPSASPVLLARLRLENKFSIQGSCHSFVMREAVVPIGPLRAATVGTPTVHLRALALWALMLGTFGVAWPYSEAVAAASARCTALASIGASDSCPPASPVPASTHDLLNFAARSSPLDSSLLQRERRWRPQRLSRGAASAAVSLPRQSVAVLTSPVPLPPQQSLEAFSTLGYSLCVSGANLRSDSSAGLRADL
jgi:hypothetical protein